MPDFAELSDAELEELRREVIDAAEARRLADRQARQNAATIARVLEKLRGILEDYLAAGGKVNALHARLDQEVAALGYVPPAETAGTGGGAGDGSGSGAGDGTGDRDNTTPDGMEPGDPGYVEPVSGGGTGGGTGTGG